MLSRLTVVSRAAKSYTARPSINTRGTALFCFGDLELNPGPTPFIQCHNCGHRVSIRVKKCSCGQNMRKRSKAFVKSFIYFNKNVHPQFEDYAHVCKELQICARVAAI